MLNEVIQIINETFNPSIELTGETSIKTDLELDSLEIVHLIWILEKKFNVEINEMEIGSLITVEDVCDYMSTR